MSGKIIIARLKHAGVEFPRPENQPARFHTHSHGDLIDTFLCRKDCFSHVDWRWGGYSGVEIAKEPETSAYDLARMTIYVSRDDNFSPYGKGLWLARDPIRGSFNSRDIFVMEAPTKEQLRAWRK